MHIMADVETTHRNAAAETGLHVGIIRMLVRDGAIPGNNYTCDIEAAQQVAQRLRAARQRAGQETMTVADAAKEYGYPRGSIYRWINSGWITRAGTDDAYNRTLIPRADIEFTSELAKIRGIRSGQEVFPAAPRSGRPKQQ